jgi:hypothetical protein
MEDFEMRFHIFQASALLLVGGFVLAIPSASWAQSPPLPPVSGCPTSGTPAPTCVVTYMYYPQRVGLNQNESTLTKSAITGAGGMQYAFRETSSSIDDQIYAQPLYLPSVCCFTGDSTHNVVYVATENNSVYAFDADTGGDGSGGSYLWYANLTPSDSSPVPESADLGCTNINPNIHDNGNVGITGTPVIDISANDPSDGTITTGTMYVVAASVSPPGCTPADPTPPPTGCIYTQTLYALSVVNGSTIASTPIQPTANTWTTGDVESTHSFVTHDSRRDNQRGALLFQSGNVYIPFSSHCDKPPWSGWLVPYSLSGSTLTLGSTPFLIDPQQDSSGNIESSIWGAGAGTAGDGTYIYTATGNGFYDITPDSEITSGSCTTTYYACNYADSLVKLNSSLAIQDFFSPADAASRPMNDWDMGSGGTMVIPDQPLCAPYGCVKGMLVQGGKEGNLYLVNKATTMMGGYQKGTSLGDSVLWEILGNAGLNGGDPSNGLCFGYTSPQDECGMWSSAAWWNNGTSQSTSTPYLSYVYVAPEGNTSGTGETKGEIIQYTLCPGSNSTFSGQCPSPYDTQPGLVLASTHVVSTDDPLVFPGLTPIITTASQTSTSAVLWALDNGNYSKNSPNNFAVVYAYNATTLDTSFWNTTSGGSLTAGGAVQFTVPMIANGKVYVGGNQQLTVYELK